MNKKIAREKRSRRSRNRIRVLKKERLCVYRTPRHIYAQIVSDDGSKTLVAVSTVEKTFRLPNQEKGNIEIANLIGKAVAERALKIGIKTVAFDRSGYKYHGRVKALAEGAREGGLEF